VADEEDPIVEAMRRKREEAEQARARSETDEAARRSLSQRFVEVFHKLAELPKQRLGDRASQAGLALSTDAPRDPSAARDYYYRLGEGTKLQFRLKPMQGDVDYSGRLVTGAAYFGEASTGKALAALNGCNFLWADDDEAWQVVRFRAMPGLRPDAQIVRDLGLPGPDSSFLFGFDDLRLLKVHLPKASRGLHVVQIDTGGTAEEVIDEIVLRALG
jgi:hypothetical protein